MTSMNNWSELIRFLIMLTLSTIKGRERAVTLTLVRGDWGHMLVVSTPSNICQYPGHCVSDVSPSPSFWIIVSCYCRSEAAPPAPGAPVRNIRQVSLFMGSGEGRGWLSLSVKQNVSCLSQTLGQNMIHPLPLSDMAYGKMSINKKVMFFFFFVWIPYFVFIISDWPGSILMCL